MARRVELLVLGLIVGVVLVQQWRFGVQSAGPQLVTDDHAVARLTAAMHASITRGVPYDPMRLAATPYPPFGPWLGAVVAVVLPGDPVRAMLHAQDLLLALMVPATWAAVRARLGPALALGVAALVPFYAAFWTIHAQFFLEVQQGFALVLVLAAWGASDGLRRLWGAAAFGLALGIGLLTKFSFVFFAAAPAVMAVAYVATGLVRAGPWRAVVFAAAVLAGAGPIAGASGHVAGALGLAAVAAFGLGVAVWRAAAPDARAVGLRVLVVVATTAAVAAPWYLRHLEVLRVFFAQNLAGGFDGEVFPVAEIWWALPGFLARGVLDDVAGGLFLVGAVRVLFDPRASTGRLALAMVVAGVVCLTVLPYRTPRYLFPLAGPALVVAGHAFGGPLVLRTVVGAALLAWGVWLQVSWGYATRWERWWTTVFEQPPNSLVTRQQLRDYLSAPVLRLRLYAAPPIFGRGLTTPAMFRRVVAAVDLAAVETISVSLRRPDSCPRLALELAAAGANPYLTCVERGELVVSPAGQLPSGWTSVHRDGAVEFGLASGPAR